MSVLNREEFFNRVKALVGEDTSDETLHTLEDFNDTFDSFSGSNSETEDWRARYEENDKMWAKRYRDRFFGNADNDGEQHMVTPAQAMQEQQNNIEEDGEKRTFEELFEEREG